MAWHQLCAAGDRLPAVSGRMPRELSSPKASRSGKMIFAVLVGNLCALTIEPPGGRKINSPRSVVLRHKAKYGEQVVYARARPGVMRRNLPAVTSGAYGEYSYNYAVV